jgi:spermidine synthase
VRQQVDLGLAELIPETGRRGWTLLVDGTPQSYVDLDDPRYLEFEYVRHLAAVVDTLRPAGQPLRVLHLGGGGLTLPRYVAATRPGSAQRVVEPDVSLTQLVRRVLPLPRGTGVRVTAADAREVVANSPPARFDLVITDAFVGGRVPAHLGTVEFAREVARVLRTGGLYGLNLVDGPTLRYTRRQVATLCAAFAQVCLIAEPGVLRHRRYGNVVLVAAAQPGTIPVDAVRRAANRDAFPARLLDGEDLADLVGRCRPITDAVATDSPDPPRALLLRRGKGAARTDGRSDGRDGDR